MNLTGKYFVTGIGTNVGKTLVSTILCKALDADYWKPVQCGSLDETDSNYIQKYSNATTFPETYKLALPASPHLAAQKENVIIDLNNFHLPETKNNLIVEGAGGMLVPLNDNELVIDIAEKFNLPLIIISAFYLGSINHTLLTLEVAKQRKLKIECVIFSGERDNSTEVIIHKFYPDVKIAFIPHLNSITQDTINEAANNFKKNYWS